MVSLSLLSRIGHVRTQLRRTLSLSFETVFDELQTEEIMALSVLALLCCTGCILGPV